MAGSLEHSVQFTGAPAGSIVVGGKPANQGARLKLSQTQPANPKKATPIRGSFTVLSPGTGKYRRAFELFVGKATDVQAFLEAGRGLGPEFQRMSYPLNTGGLILEISRPFRIPEEVQDPERFLEGATRRIPVNAYERSREARRACIDHHGSRCSICDFDFGSFYGEIGVGYIHVHHLVPLAVRGSSYRVDPVKELRPVCPNCHAMLHCQDPPLSPDELRRRIHRP